MHRTGESNRRHVWEEADVVGRKIRLGSPDSGWMIRERVEKVAAFGVAKK